MFQSSKATRGMVSASPWLYHCQVPEHAHMGMMGDLLVQ